MSLTSVTCFARHRERGEGGSAAGSGATVVGGRQFAEDEQQDDGGSGGDRRSSARLCCRALSAFAFELANSARYDLASIRHFERQNMRDRNTQVRPPSPILVKLAPEVGIGPKTHHAKYFLIFVA